MALDLTEEIIELKEAISEIKIEMSKTCTLIRDYNGLREKLNKMEIKLSEACAREDKENDMIKQSNKQKWKTRDFILGILMLILTVVTIIK